jgi:hypothetical protein
MPGGLSETDCGNEMTGMKVSRTSVPVIFMENFKFLTITAVIQRTTL